MSKSDHYFRPTPDNFAIQNEKTKPICDRLIRMLVLACNKHKLGYGSLRYVYRQVMVRSNISRPRSAKKLYELLTSDELNKFFESIADEQMRLIHLLIHNTGIRVGEAVAIKTSDIDFDNDTILINGKGRKQRLVPLTERMKERLRLFLSGRNHKYLFESERTGKPFTTRRVEQVCRQARTKAGITKKFTIHSLRHLYFSKMAELNIDSSIRMMLAGHSSEATQKIYNHLGLDGSKPQILEALKTLETNGVLK